MVSRRVIRGVRIELAIAEAEEGARREALRREAHFTSDVEIVQAFYFSHYLVPFSLFRLM